MSHRVAISTTPTLSSSSAAVLPKDMTLLGESSSSSPAGGGGGGFLLSSSSSSTNKKDDDDFHNSILGKKSSSSSASSPGGGGVGGDPSNFSNLTLSSSSVTAAEATAAGSSSQQQQQQQFANYCRVSLFMWWTLALSAAIAVYIVVTKLVFPLVVNNHHERRRSSSSSSSDSTTMTSTWALSLIIGLSCAVSTAVPGLFTISCVAAGFALGFGLGSFVAVLAVLIGLTFSFEGGRTLFRERASALVSSRFPSAQHLSSLHPTKAVWVSWFFPVPLAIKIFFWASCSNVSLARFMVSVSVVAVPHISTLAYIGDQATGLTDGKGGAQEKFFFALGVASVLVASVVLSKWAQKAVSTAALEKSVEKSFGITPE